MESKRNKQVAEIIKRNFGIVLQQEGGYIYGLKALVTVTGVQMSPDYSIAKIYVSVYNIENKQAVIVAMENSMFRLRQSLVTRIRKHVRRIPHIQFYLDETLDEMFRLNNLFNRLEDENQMGDRNEDNE